MNAKTLVGQVRVDWSPTPTPDIENCSVGRETGSERFEIGQVDELVAFVDIVIRNSIV